MYESKWRDNYLFFECFLKSNLLCPFTVLHFFKYVVLYFHEHSISYLIAALTKPDKIVRSYKCGRCSLTALCRLFRSDESRVTVSKSCTSAVMKIYLHADDATQLVLLGMKNVHEEHDWQGFVCCSNAMAKRFLNYICCNPFNQLEPI